MAVALTGTPASANASGPASPYTAFTYTPETGSDRCAFVAVGTGNGTTDDISGITIGGQTMTQIGSFVYDGGWVGVCVFYIKEAGIAAMSGNTVSVAGTLPNQLGIMAWTLTGVDQTTPITGEQSGSGTSGTTAQASAAVSSTADGMVIGVVMSDEDVAATLVESHTLIREEGPLPTGAGDTILNAQRTAGTGGSINVTWTQSSNRYAVRTFNVQSSGAAATGKPRMNQMSTLGVS